MISLSDHIALGPGKGGEVSSPNLPLPQYGVAYGSEWYRIYRYGGGGGCKVQNERFA